MRETSPDENLRRVLAEFENELVVLQTQQVITKLDAQKIKAQAEISSKAMNIAENEPGFTDRAKDKLQNALIRDFEKSILKLVDEAVARRGDRALLTHRLNRVDRRIALQVSDLNISHIELGKLEMGMKLLRSYILRTLPEKKNGFLGGPKPDSSSMIGKYEETLLDFIRNNLDQHNLRG